MAEKVVISDEEKQLAQTALRRFFANVVDLISEPSNIAGKLFTANIITSEVFDTAIETCSGLTAKNKANIVMQDVYKGAGVYGERFLMKFCTVLEKEEKMQAISHGIRDYYHYLQNVERSDYDNTNSNRQVTFIAPLQMEDAYIRMKANLGRVVKDVYTVIASKTDGICEIVDFYELAFKDDLTCPLDGISSVQKLAIALRDQHTLANYTKLEALVDHLSETIDLTEAKNILERFAAERKKYFENILIEDFAKHIMQHLDDKTLRDNEIEIKIVVPWAKNESTLADFQNLLMRVFHNARRYITLRAIHFSWSIFLCSIPQSMTKVFVKLIKERSSILEKEGIICISVNTDIIYENLANIKKPDSKKRSFITKISSFWKKKRELQSKESPKRSVSLYGFTSPDNQSESGIGSLESSKKFLASLKSSTESPSHGLLQTNYDLTTPLPLEVISSINFFLSHSDKEHPACYDCYHVRRKFMKLLNEEESFAGIRKPRSMSEFHPPIRSESYDELVDPRVVDLLIERSASCDNNDGDAFPKSPSFHRLNSC
jgi:hypothetical protein